MALVTVIYLTIFMERKRSLLISRWLQTHKNESLYMLQQGMDASKFRLGPSGLAIWVLIIVIIILDEILKSIPRRTITPSLTPSFVCLFCRFEREQFIILLRPPLVIALCRDAVVVHARELLRGRGLRDRNIPRVTAVMLRARIELVMGAG
ncbi:4Fe-4S binding protein [Sesbania bispinosa]|nr:4Fe-4S binding protein [Sesbania bispinosa]